MALLAFNAVINLSNSSDEETLEEGQCPTVIIICNKTESQQGFYLQSEKNGIAIDLGDIRHAIVQRNNGYTIVTLELHDIENNGTVFTCTLGTSNQTNNTLQYIIVHPPDFITPTTFTVPVSISTGHGMVLIPSASLLMLAQALYILCNSRLIFI